MRPPTANDAGKSGSALRLIGPCPRIEELIRAISGELHPTEQDRIQRHVAECRMCGDTVRAAGGFRSDVAGSPAPAPSTAPVTGPAGGTTATASPAASIPLPQRRRRGLMAAMIIAGVSFAIILGGTGFIAWKLKSKFDNSFSATSTSNGVRVTTPADPNVKAPMTPGNVLRDVLSIRESIGSLGAANAAFRAELARPPRGMKASATTLGDSNAVIRGARSRPFAIGVPVPQVSEPVLQFVDSQGTAIWSRPLKSAGKTVRINFPAGSLASGVYRAEVLTTGGQKAADYQFQIID